MSYPLHAILYHCSELGGLLSVVMTIIVVTCTGCLFSEHSRLPLPSLDSSLHRLVPFGPYPPTDCQLSVWRPGEAVRGVIQEGKVLRMFNINAAPSRYMCMGGCGCGSMCICACGWLARCPLLQLYIITTCKSTECGGVSLPMQVQIILATTAYCISLNKI